MHRIALPPGAQAALDRYSVAYFSRPGYDSPLRALTDESAVIKAAVDAEKPEERAKFFPNTTAGEWYNRRIKYIKLINKKV